MAKDYLTTISNKELDAIPDWQKKTLNRDNPLPWQTYLPDEIAGPGNSNSLANKVYSKGATPGYLEGQAMAGVGNDSIGGPSNALGGNNAMSSAIDRKYQAQAGNKLAGIKAQADANAPIMQSGELARAAEIYGKDQAISMQNFKEQDAYQQKRVALYNAYTSAKSGAEAAMWAQIAGGAATIAAVA